MLTWVVFECFAAFDWFSEDLWLEFSHELVSVFPFRATTLTLFWFNTINHLPSIPTLLSVYRLFLLHSSQRCARSFLSLLSLRCSFFIACVFVCQRWFYFCFRWSLHSPFLILSFLPLILLCWFHSLVCFHFGSLQMEYRTNCPVKPLSFDGTFLSFSVLAFIHSESGSLWLCCCPGFPWFLQTRHGSTRHDKHSACSFPVSIIITVMSATKELLLKGEVEASFFCFFIVFLLLFSHSEKELNYEQYVKNISVKCQLVLINNYSAKPLVPNNNETEPKACKLDCQQLITSSPKCRKLHKPKHVYIFYNLFVS